MYMDIKYAVSTFGTGFPNNTLAAEYGEHILNVKLESDTPNGALVSVDTDNAWVSFDVFAEKAATTFKGIVEQQMTDGSWLVCCTDPGDSLFIYQKPLTPYERPRELTEEKAFYNKAGSIVRGYRLAPFDRISVSADNFVGTPEAGAKVNGVQDKKMKISE